MSLVLPLQIGDQFSASKKAKENFKALQGVSLYGGKEQIATNTALENLAEISRLQPGYLDGFKSWGKALGVYTIGGIGGAVILGLSGYGAFLTYNSGWSLGAFTTVITTEFLGSKIFGISPISNLSFAYLAAVRDAANRAAKWSTKQDANALKKNAEDVQKCHEAICKELRVVYDDCGKYLGEKASTKVEDIKKAVKFREKLANFEREKLPVIETLLRDFQLSKNETAAVLQRLKDWIQIAKETACELSPHSSASQRNAEILSRYPEESLRDLVIPSAIQKRINLARNAQMGSLGKISGYAAAVVPGAKAFVVTATALAAIVACGAAYFTPALFSELAGGLAIPPTGAALQATQGITGIAGLSAIATTVKECKAHSHRIRENAKACEEKINACKEDLQAIYRRIDKRLSPEKQAKILPIIREEIQKLHIVKNPAEILG